MLNITLRLLTFDYTICCWLCVIWLCWAWVTARLQQGDSTVLVWSAVSDVQAQSPPAVKHLQLTREQCALYGSWWLFWHFLTFDKYMSIIISLSFSYEREIIQRRRCAFNRRLQQTTISWHKVTDKVTAAANTDLIRPQTQWLSIHCWIKTLM